MMATTGDGTNSIPSLDLVQMQIHIEKHLHKRHLEVYESEAIECLAGANVLIFGLQGLGVEVGICSFIISSSYSFLH